MVRLACLLAVARSSRVRVVAAVVLMAMAGSVARADPPSNGEPTTTNESARYRQRAKQVEHVGEWLTGVGLVHIAVGVPLLAVGLTTPSCHADACSDAPLFYLAPAFGMLGVGVLLLGAGVPAWIVGHQRHERARPANTASSDAAGLTIRF
jgi:hypothetical protein